MSARRTCFFWILPLGWPKKRWGFTLCLHGHPGGQCVKQHRPKKRREKEIKRRERHSQLMHSNSRFFPVIHKKKGIFAPIHWILSDLFNQAFSLADFESSRWITPGHAPGVTTISDRWKFLAAKSAIQSARSGPDSCDFFNLIQPLDLTPDHRERSEVIEADPTRSTPPKSTPGSIIFFEKGSNIVQKMRLRPPKPERRRRAFSLKAPRNLFCF